MTTVTAGSAVATVPKIAGDWRGSYSYLLFATGAAASPNNHEVLMTLNEDTKGNLTGTFCLGLVSPGCFIVKGKVGFDSAVEIQFDAISNPFILKGKVASMFCLDASAGKVISGGFTVREGSGGFSFNNCPVVSLPVEAPAPVEPAPVAPTVEPVAVAPVVDPVPVAPTLEPVAVAPTVDPVPVAPTVEPVAVAPAVDPVPAPLVASVTAGSAVAEVPQIAGDWYGSYSYQFLATGTVAPPNNHEVLMTLGQDTQGNLTGTFCLGAVSPGCYLVKGQVVADSTVSIRFDAISDPFALDGNVASMFCLDGSPGKVMSGGFTVREGSGAFSFNNCPLVSVPVEPLP